MLEDLAIDHATRPPAQRQIKHSLTDRVADVAEQLIGPRPRA